MSRVYEKLIQCYEYVKEQIEFKPKTAIILGSGFGEFADQIDVKAEIAYSQIPGFPVSTVEGHDGTFIFGYAKEVPCVLMKGRVHYYEGYEMEDVVLPVRLMRLMGAEILLLTNASGGVNRAFEPGDVMMLTDQISSFVPSPLIGENIKELGTRFPDMSEIYDKELQSIIRNTAKKEQIPLREGVYLQFTGPNYESPAEVRMAGILGADAVGMSTACEAIAAKHMGMRICGLSCITNMACGISETPLNHEEVQQIAGEKAPMLKRLMQESVLNIYREIY